MERAVGALGPAATAAEGPAAAMSAAEDLAAAGEGPVAGEEGPWLTRGLKV